LIIISIVNEKVSCRYTMFAPKLVIALENLV